MQKIPEYYRIVQDIEQSIADGSMKKGEKLPNEKYFIKHYGVGSTEVRRAIMELTNWGKVRGEDLVIVDESKTIMERLPEKISSFFEETQDCGYKPSSIVHGKDIIPCNKELRDEMRLQENDLIIKIDRTRMIDGELAAFQTNYIPYKLCPGFLEDDIAEQSLQNLLTQKYKFNMVRAIEYVQAEVANEVLAKLLKVQKGIPILKIIRKTYLEGDIVGVYAVLRFKGDSYKYKSLLKVHN
jgi:GntR family transcriptional regulator